MAGTRESNGKKNIKKIYKVGNIFFNDDLSSQCTGSAVTVPWQNGGRNWDYFVWFPPPISCCRAANRQGPWVSLPRPLNEKLKKRRREKSQPMMLLPLGPAGERLHERNDLVSHSFARRKSTKKKTKINRNHGEIPHCHSKSFHDDGFHGYTKLKKTEGRRLQESERERERGERIVRFRALATDEKYTLF